MRWDPRVRYAHTVDILSTCTTTSTNLPTPQVESSLSWSRAMVYQQVTMVFIDYKLSIYSRPLTGIMTSFPTLEGNQDLIPDLWWESDFVWWTTTRRRRFGSLYRRSLRLHLLEQGGIQIFSFKNMYRGAFSFIPCQITCKNGWHKYLNTNNSHPVEE